MHRLQDKSCKSSRLRSSTKSKGITLLNISSVNKRLIPKCCSRIQQRLEEVKEVKQTLKTVWEEHKNDWLLRTVQTRLLSVLDSPAAKSEAQAAALGMATRVSNEEQPI